MKKVLIALMSVALLGGMSSCNKWLDVDADTRVGENIIFESTNGMRIALNGIYLSLGEPTLYGQNLTWGLMSVLAKDYKDGNLPAAYRNTNLIVDGEWNENYSRGIIDPIWSKTYNVLANINNLLQAVEKADESMFLEYPTLERNLFMAELRGLRALLHFNLLRMFAPAPKNDDGKAYIPYVEKYPDYQPKKLTVSQTMDKIEADLLYSAQLLADIDTMGSAGTTEFNAGPYRAYSGTYRFNTGSSYWVDKGQWYSNAGTRFNYPAVTALLARLYMWKGDKNAVIEATKYLRYKSWYEWGPKVGSNNWQNNSSSRKLYKDVLFAAYNPDLPENYANVNKSANFRYDTKLYDEYFGAANNSDYRKNLMSTETNKEISLRWQAPASATTDSKLEDPIAPVVRISELYLYLVEIYADTDLEKARNLLFEFRSYKRNAKRDLSYIQDKETLMHELELEWAREFQSMGERYFFYKRLGKSIYQGADVARFDYNETNCWVFQQPLAEDSYSL